MEVAQKYGGNRHIAIIYNGTKYIFISRINSDFLTKKIPLYSKERGSMVLARYEGVSDGALWKVIRAVNLLNDRKNVNLEKLLEEKN